MIRAPRGQLLAVLRLAVALLVIVAVLAALASNWSQVATGIRRVDAATLGAALLLALVGPVLALLGWRVLLADLGSPLAVAPASGVFFVGQLGKYLPGSVWTVLAQAEMASRLHVPRRRSAVAGLLGIGLSVLSGLAVGLPAAPLLVQSGHRGELAWALLAVPVLVLALWPRLLNAVVARGLRMIGREPLEHDLSAGAVVVTMGWFMGSWLAFGVQTWLLARAVAPGLAWGGGAGTLLLASVSGYALAGTVGMLTVIAPAGVGVREGVLVLLLVPLTGQPGALAVVVLSRFAVTVGDVLLALAGWSYARRHHLVSAHPAKHQIQLSDEP